MSDEAYKGSGNFISEAVTSMRTVASFNNEYYLVNLLKK